MTIVGICWNNNIIMCGKTKIERIETYYNNDIKIIFFLFKRLSEYLYYI